jgi:hypothetical protein
MFGFGTSKLRSDAKNIIALGFKTLSGADYQVAPMYEPLFKEMAEHIKLKGGNAYDLAIAFMYTMLNGLTYELKESEREWAASIGNRCEALMVRGTIGNIAILTNPRNSEENSRSGEQTFDLWFKEFNRACRAAKPAVADMLEFMDIEPLKRAHRDGLDPTILGVQFASDFKPETLSRSPRSREYPVPKPQKNAEASGGPPVLASGIMRRISEMRRNLEPK